MRVSLRTGGLRGWRATSAHRHPTGAGLPATGRRLRRVGNCIVCAVIVGVAAVTLGFKVHNDVKITAALIRPTAVRNFTTSDAGWQCIYRSIRAGVPRGASVYIDFPNVLYFQRIAELTTTWAMPRQSLPSAQWRLFIFKAPEHCGGLELAVVRA